MASDQLNVAVSLPTIVGMPPVLAQVRADTAAILALLNGGVTPTPTPTVTFLDPVAVSVSEGDVGEIKTLTFYVGRSTTSGSVSIPYIFNAGGTNAADYPSGLPGNGSVNIADGQLAGTIVITVGGDVDVESDEAFSIALTPPAGYAPGASMLATGTILNNDMPQVGFAWLSGDTTSQPAGAVSPQQSRANSAGTYSFAGSGAPTVDANTGVWQGNSAAAANSAITFTERFTRASDGQVFERTHTHNYGAALPASGSTGQAFTETFNGAANVLLSSRPGWQAGAVNFTNGGAAPSDNVFKLDGNGALMQTTFIDGQFVYTDFGASLLGATIRLPFTVVNQVDFGTALAAIFPCGSGKFVVVRYTPISSGGTFGRFVYYDNVAGTNSEAPFDFPNPGSANGSSATFYIKPSVDGASVTVGIEGQSETTVTLKSGFTIKQQIGFAPIDQFGGQLKINDLSINKAGTGTLTILSQPAFSKTNAATIKVGYTGPKPAYLQHRPQGSSDPWRTSTIVSSTGTTSGEIVYSASELTGGSKALDVRSLSDTTAAATTDPIYFLDPLTKPLTLGQNAQTLFDAYGARQKYTNLLVASYVQETNNFAFVPRDSQYLTIEGWPKQANVIYSFSLPSEEGNHTLQLSWDGGPMTFQWGIFPDQAAEGGWTVVSTWQQVGPNLYESTININRTTAPGIVFGNFKITGVTAGNLPTNLFMCKKGADKSKRFIDAYIDYMKLLKGDIRHLDSMGGNTDGSLEGKLIWDRRTKVGYIATGSLDSVSGSNLCCVEDILEVSRRSGRRPWLCLAPALFYGAAGLDFLDRICDMVYTGAGVENSANAGGLPSSIGVKLEVANEPWFQTGGRLIQDFFAQKAAAAGRPGAGTYDANDGAKKITQSIIERFYLQKFLMDRVTSRLGAAAAARTTIPWNLQTGLGNLQGVMSTTGWSTFEPYITEFTQAPYIPTDTNVNGVATQPASHSPADIVTWMRGFLPGIAKYSADSWRAIRALGKRRSIYEFNAALTAINSLTRAESLALRRSSVWRAFWRDEIIPMLALCGNDVCAFTDNGLIPAVGNSDGFGAGQQWVFEAIVGTDVNAQWDEWVSYAQAH